MQSKESFSAQQHEVETVDNYDNQKHDADQTEHEADDGHSGNMIPLLFVIITLIIGAATRHFLKSAKLPYTVLLLIIGILLGAASRIGWFSSYHLGFFTIDLTFFSEAVSWAGKIDPHLIMYVFLPTLIFEAAFAMDVHTFKKSFTNAFLLAVPGIIGALLLTGLAVFALKFAGLGFQNWTWQIALLFGAIVSATDPVAVVSILKEMGASKKLGTLIEGESLLNDGTAIVIFMVFFLPLTGVISETSPVFEFLRVAIGGALVGVVIGWITIRWVKKVFNDALVEITIIVAAAYLTFFIAEHFLHVSGVLGLVALGLLMASIGRTRISPEVEHFLHEFWELAAFIANTLIFVIVGVVISNQVVFTGSDFINLIILYIAIHIVRAIIITVLYPFMKKAGYGLPKKNAYVLWWGALRGAIGLALALIVAGESKIDPVIRQQLLFYTAGLVTLTLLINATTIKAFVNILGINKIAPSKAQIIRNAKIYLRQASENNLSKLKKDRFLNKADWNAVSDYLPEGEEDIQEVEFKTQELAELRRRVLEKEKSSYWKQFKEGMLGPLAVRSLSEAINEIIDADGQIPLSDRKDLEGLWKTSKILSKLQSLPVVGKITQRLFFDRLAISYDSAKGFVTAQYDCLKLVEDMMIKTAELDATQDRNLSVIEEEINENRIHGLTFLRNLKNTYPEIYGAITTRHAIRTNLNYEKRTVERLLKKGQIGADESFKIIESIEERMKILVDTPPEAKPPEKAKLLEDVEWLKSVDKTTFTKIVNLFQHRIYSVGENIIKEKSHVDGIYVVARGSVKVTKEGKLLDILGKGSVIGEVAVLNNIHRTATVTAESPVTVLRLTSVSMQQVIQDNQTLEDKLWEIAAPRVAENLFSEDKKYKSLTRKDIREMAKNGKIIYSNKIKNVDLKDKIGILVQGKVIMEDNSKLVAPCIIEADSVTLSRSSRILVCTLKSV